MLCQAARRAARRPWRSFAAARGATATSSGTTSPSALQLPPEAPPSQQPLLAGPLAVYTHGVNTGKYRADAQQVCLRAARQVSRAAFAHSRCLTACATPLGATAGRHQVAAARLGRVQGPRGSSRRHWPDARRPGTEQLDMELVGRHRAQAGAASCVGSAHARPLSIRCERLLRVTAALFSPVPTYARWRATQVASAVARRC